MIPSKDELKEVATDVGLYRKFNVTRTDGESCKGGKHYGCFYFVLDVSCDPFAIFALKAYAKACAKEYPVLAADILKLVSDRETP